jgi:hypothetical protein
LSDLVLNTTVTPPTTTTTLAPTTTTTVAPTTTTTTPVVPSGCPSPCFTDNFPWTGPHAATITRGASNDKTVWLDNARWDAGIDMGQNSAMAPRADGNHIDIHKAVSATLANGDEVVNGTSSAKNGDGTPGLLAMRSNQQGDVSARARVPLAISATQPAVVEFWAPKYLTLGHWWEVSISPVSGRNIDSKYTALPNGTAQNTGPDGNGFAAGPGSVHGPSEDSINVIPRGFPDNCINDGWKLMFGGTRVLNGVATDIEPKLGTNDVDGVPVSLYNLQADLLTDIGRAATTLTPAEVDTVSHTLRRFRIEFRQDPGKIILWGDLKNTGTLTKLRTLNSGVPVAWSQVYVHLLGAFYNMQGHPNPSTCYPSSAAGVTTAESDREIHWRNVSMGPLAFTATKLSVFPPEVDGPETGWMAVDGRDNQRADTVSVPMTPPQPNRVPGSASSIMNYASFFANLCSGPNGSSSGTAGWGSCPNPTSLTFNTGTVAGFTSARLLYDVRRMEGVSSGGNPVRPFQDLYPEGTVSASFNGAASIALKKAGEFAAVPPQGWIRRFVTVPIANINVGANTITLSSTGNVVMDRFQLELIR